MNVPVASLVSAGPVAGQPLLDSIRKALTAGPQTDETVAFLVGVAALVLLVVVSARCFGRPRSTGGKSRVDYLTPAVDVLGLSESDRRDLQRIARRAGLEQPVAMLLSPANLARAAAPTLAAENDDELRRRIEHLCVRLFDTPLPDPERLAQRRP
jgi:hypothetical protein